MKRHPNEKIAVEAFIAKHKSLTEAAASIGVTKAMLSQVRLGKARIPDKMAEKIGWEWRLVNKQKNRSEPLDKDKTQC